MNTFEINRRNLIKTALAGAAAGALNLWDGSASQAAENRNPQIGIAGYAYDRVRAIQDGRLGLDGYNINFQVENIYAVNQYVFGSEKKYEVSEIGLIPYLTKYANEDFRAYTLIPIFISRIFRHRNIYVHVDAGIEKPADLRGKRVGAPGYGSSANTWIRGLLRDEYGVKHDEIKWIETTKSSDRGPVTGGGGFSAFESDGPRYFLPDDFPLVQGPPGVDESELLLTRGCDALIAPITPKAFQEGNPKIRQLFPDAPAAERAYFKKTGLFPIMHAVAIRRDFADANPELPKKLFSLYSQAKQMAYDDLETTTSLKVTLPWVTQEFEDTRALMGDNFWPYGVKANRKELELVMRYIHEQGLAKRRLKVEEVFHPSTLELSES
jgi:4,5-dihydroxyphthalate decarboxylase